ncbi:MAG TPA: sugar transferase [Blastocatellia bacterium]|nr:sugar transferase [Blastocatellia bacterium]HMX27636.1 sugar transferase [Blastocatellia bacterium]HMZ17123.1 sugar transferase [Blastocatellia bacterium]HNG32627.1 sugar transferase [Blastocatellia bacterium]
MSATTVSASRHAPTGILPLSEYAIKLITGALVFFDGALAALLFLFALWLRHADEALFRFTPIDLAGFSFQLPYDLLPNFAPYLSVLSFVPLIHVAAFLYRGLYRVRGEFSFSEDFINIFKAVSIGALLVTVTAFFYRGGFAYSTFSYSRIVFILYYLLSLTVFVVYRAGLRSLQTFYRRRHINVIPILIVGSNGVAEMCVNEIAHEPRLGRRVVGFITANGKPPKSKALHAWPTLGRYEEMHRFIRLYNIGEILITDPDIPTQMLFDTMVKCGRGSRVTFRVVPNLLNCIPRKTYVEQLGAVPMVRLFEEPLSATARMFKRSVDLAASLLILLVTAPLWLLIAIAVKLESRGPLFYRQERVGMDGQIFLLYKFRSMLDDVELDEAHREYMQRVITKQGDINLGTEDAPSYKFINGSRLTRVGSWLRQTSLDELPQLFNVLKGEMSLVGPRPPIPYEVECYEAWHRKRLDVKPGLTGLWQVSGRYRVSFEQMVQLDIYYIENWSLWLDLKIILKTLPALFMREQA